MWEVHYSQEAATYLEDNGELITDLFFAVEALAESDGMPVTGNFQAIQGLVYWIIQDHMVVYRRLEFSQVARILFMKPDS